MSDRIKLHDLIVVFSLAEHVDHARRMARCSLRSNPVHFLVLIYDLFFLEIKQSFIVKVDEE